MGLYMQRRRGKLDALLELVTGLAEAEAGDGDDGRQVSLGSALHHL